MSKAERSICGILSLFGFVCCFACVPAQLLSHVQLFATPWTVVHQDSLSMGFPRQKYWSGLPFPPTGDIPDSGIEPACSALAGGFFATEPLGKLCYFLIHKRAKIILAVYLLIL